jgi:hypothetical protein
MIPFIVHATILILSLAALVYFTYQYVKRAKS